MTGWGVTGRGGVRGALIGAAAAIKVWPVTLLAGLAPGQQRRGLAAAAVVLAAICAAFAPATASFLAHQNDRGVEIESVAATPFMIWRQAGWAGRWRTGSARTSSAGRTWRSPRTRPAWVWSWRPRR